MYKSLVWTLLWLLWTLIPGEKLWSLLFLFCCLMALFLYALIAYRHTHWPVFPIEASFHIILGIIFQKHLASGIELRSLISSAISMLDSSFKLKNVLDPSPKPNTKSAPWWRALPESWECINTSGTVADSCGTGWSIHLPPTAVGIQGITNLS